MHHNCFDCLGSRSIEIELRLELCRPIFCSSRIHLATPDYLERADQNTQTINLFRYHEINHETKRTKQQQQQKTMSLRNPNTLVSLPTDDTFDYLFKIVLIGDCGTGKTCVVQRFKTGHYEERHGNTIGVDFSMKTIAIEGKKIKVMANSIEHSEPWYPIHIIRVYSNWFRFNCGTQLDRNDFGP